MIFTNHEVSQPLAQHIEAIFHLKDFIPDHSKERVIPTGRIFLIFELDNFKRHTYDNDNLESNGTYQLAWISGQHDEFITISAHAHSEMLVVQFKPYGLFPFVQQSLDDFSNKVVGAEQIFGHQLPELRKKLIASPTSQKKFELIEEWLTSIYDETMDCPDEIIQVINEIHLKTDQNLNAATNEYPLSAKHLIDQFKKFVGTTPKRYHRTMRFNSILQKINNKSPVYWADIAYQCGYSDQSHFIKEFKRFSGFNPSEFIATHSDQSNFFPLDRPG